MEHQNLNSQSGPYCPKCDGFKPHRVMRFCPQHAPRPDYDTVRIERLRVALSDDAKFRAVLLRIAVSFALLSFVAFGVAVFLQ